MSKQRTTGCIHQQFEVQVESTPDATAIVCAGASLTYETLNHRANQLAHYLKSLGVGPEVLVAICLDRSLEMAVALLAILKAGGAYVPLDPHYPRDRLAFMVEHSQARFLLTDRPLGDSLPPHQAQVIDLEQEWAKITTFSDQNPVSAVKPDHLAYIIYTSGSTGQPKGVAVEHGAVLNTLVDINDRFKIGPGDRVLAVSSLCFDLSVYDIFGLLIAGGTVVMPNPSPTPDPHHWAAVMVQQQITVWNSAPALIQMLIDATLGQPDPLPASLRVVLLSGDWIPLSLPEQIKALVSGVQVIGLGGATEASIWSILYPIKTIDPSWKSIPYGQAMRNQRFYVLDETLQPCPEGVPGQLYIGGVGLARCYWRDEAKTQSRFITHPQTSERLYCTGDLGSYRSDGNIEFIGRIDNQVKIRGFRIELGEVEAVLNQHPDVRQAVVIDREDVRGSKRLVAYILTTIMPDRLPYLSEALAEDANQQQVSIQTEDFSTGGVAVVGVPENWRPQQGIRLELRLPGCSEPCWFSGQLAWCRGNKAGVHFNLNPEEAAIVATSFNHLLETAGFYTVWQRTVSGNWRRFLGEKLPEYMVPSSFVFLDHFPLTPNGKVNRQALPEPKRNAWIVPEDAGAPSTPIEQVVADIWAEVLSVERVGVHDNFLELGGHSLLATQIVSRVREAFQCNLPLRALFNAPTVAQLAKQLETLRQEELEWQGGAIAPVERDRRLPTSFAQEQLWFLHQWQPLIPMYNEPVTVYLRGPIDLTALNRSLNEIIRRHESLRTTFQAVEGQPVQVIHPVLKLSLNRINLQGQSETQREAQALQIASTEARKPFDLSKGPLVRATLIPLSETDYRLFLTLHHIIIDAVSLYQVFLPELAALYQAFTTGTPSPLPEVSLQYADFAVWQRQSLPKEVLERQMGYWTKQLAHLSPLQLPTDHLPSGQGTFQGAKQYMTLSPPLTAALKALSMREGVTLFTLLLTAFKTLLYRYTQQEDLCVGTVTAGRDRPEIENLIGYFLNTLVLRTDLSGNPRFRDLLPRVEEVCLLALAHQDLPFSHIVRTLQPERQGSQNPLVQVMFVLEPPIPTNDLGWTLEQLDVDTGTAKLDLSVQLEERGERIVGYWEYNTQLFDPTTIARAIGHFQTLLEEIVAHPEHRISELSLITPQERAEILAWNQTEVDYPRTDCIHQWFEAQVDQTPDAVAVVFEDQELTYRELNQRANQLAHYLQTLGVGPEVLVGLCVDRSLELVIGVLGILKAGGAYLPLDPDYPSERLAFMLADTRVRLLLTQEDFCPRLGEQSGQLICLDRDWGEIAQQSRENPGVPMRSDHLAYVIYTSGSTGQPKGVMLAHQGLCNLAQAQIQLFKLSPDSHVLQFASISFDASVWEMLMAWMSGATLYLIQKTCLLSGSALVEQIRRHQITTVTLPPSILAMLPQEEVKTLQTIIVAGEACSGDLVSQWGTGRRFFNAYGPTESTVCATVAEAVANQQSPPIGRAIANTQVYVLDAQMQLLPVGVPGELYIGGDGLARGYLNRPDLTRDRFVPNPFSPQPGARLYKTGDLARYLPDGNLEFLGRIDHQVKIRGLRIELGEIESVLTQHPDVQAATVIVREDIPQDERLIAYIVSRSMPDRVPYRGNCWVELPGDRPVQVQSKNLSRRGIGIVGLSPCQPGTWVRLRFGPANPFGSEWVTGQVAWSDGLEAGIDFNLTPDNQQRLQQLFESLLDQQGFSKVLQRTHAGTLRRYLLDHLPAYMVPSSFLFLKALPLTLNGKVNRKALPKPEADRRDSEARYLPPKSEMEKAIASIWQGVLHLEQVGIQDNFFDLGGHSLSMAQVHRQLLELLAAEISLVELFQYPTIATLAQRLIHLSSPVPPQSALTHESEGFGHQGDRRQDSSISRAHQQKEAIARQKQSRQPRRYHNG
ncbi:amino acid adenylation domain-containing protein [Laspinema sp. A4]|uniref:non-ribosomal peptide synthetase n=1 Tax=Laspinema sp. D2d TaxID=2953686 RepID=UPI0021BB7771|nr:non-ribosomal peptide synthetase [Laspinema sp. D2d]MCT7982347.1 amino acid adenylation domain-containing protein [Laspinema sp. D2d]